MADQAYSASRLREAEKRLETETRHGQAIVREGEARIQQLEELQPLEIRAQEAEVRMIEELLSIGVEKHQAAFSSGTWLTGTPLTYLAPW